MPLLGGVRPPIAALLVVLLAVAGTTALVLSGQERRNVDAAVLTTQQRVAEDGALSLRASLDESVVDLRRAARTFNGVRPESESEVLARLDRVYDKWRGKAIIDPASGRLLAASGETIPLAAVRERPAGAAGLRPKLIKLASGEARMLVFAPLKGEAGTRLLVASGTLKVPSISTDDDRTLSVIDTAGTVLAAEGPEDGRDFLAAHTPQILAQVAKEEAETDEVPAGSLPGQDEDGDRLAAGYAAVAVPDARDEPSPAGALGLTVITSVIIEEDPVTIQTRIFGLISAAALIVIALIVSGLLYATLQRPLLILYRESRRLTRGDLQRPVPPLRFGEAARISRALESLRLQLLGSPREEPPRAGRRGGATVAVALCAVLVLVWSLPLLFLFNRAGASVTVPQRLVVDQRLRTDTMADRVRRALNEGYADLLSTAQTSQERLEAGDADKLLKFTIDRHDRYRSLYILDGDGEVLARAGDEPRHPEGEKPHPDSVVQLNTEGKEPIVAGYARIPGGSGAAVVGEFKPQFLITLVTRPGLGRVYLVDEERRLIAADRSKGFRAFTELPGRRLRDLALTANRADRSSSILFRGEDTAIAAAAPFSGGGAAQGLGWQVVSKRPAAWLTLPEYIAQRRTMLAGMLGVAAAAACLGWLYIVVVRPLGSVAGRAEALAGGDRRTVLFPQHHDEVGAVVRNLELVRQQMQEQPRKRILATSGTADGRY